jgi:carboxymethylenebutenolidase
MAYDALLAETVTITGAGGDPVQAYVARPLRQEPLGGVVVLHYLLGADDATKEIVRRFAAEGYNAVMPNLYWREAPGAAPDDAAAAVRAALGGIIPDSRLLGDVAGAADYLRGLSNSNGRAGVIGYCSGGRQATLAGCSLPLDAAVNCYGVLAAPRPDQLPPGTPLPKGQLPPVLPLIPQLSCPLLCLYGALDPIASPDQGAELELALTSAGKTYEFHSYEGAGHAFFSVDHSFYNVEAAVDGWRRILDWFGKYLA